MFLRKMRWLCASVVAVLAIFAAPSRSMADTQILIQELDGGGNAVTTQIFTGTSASFATTNFQTIQVTTTPNSGSISSLNTTVTAALASGLDTTHSLQVIVTSDGFINPFPGQPATIDNNVGASSGIVGGTNIITGTTQLFDVPLTIAANQTGTLASGNVIAGPTAVATDTRPSSGSANDTTANSANLPANFAIQQTIVVRATDSTGILSGSTVGGTVGSTVLTNAAPVPAPAGLILALAAVPALGLRRILRRNS
jgi:hypothetical protein